MQVLSKLRENCTLFCWELYQELFTISAMPLWYSSCYYSPPISVFICSHGCKRLTEGTGDSKQETQNQMLSNWQRSIKCENTMPLTFYKISFIVILSLFFFNSCSMTILNTLKITSLNYRFEGIACYFFNLSLILSPVAHVLQPLGSFP